MGTAHGQREEKKTAWRRRATAFDIISLRLRTWEAAIPGRLRLTEQVLQSIGRFWGYNVILVENKVWKQDSNLASEGPTWSDGAYHSPSCQIGKLRGCCPSAGRSNSGLGAAALQWNLVDTPGLSYIHTTVKKGRSGQWRSMGTQLWIIRSFEVTLRSFYTCGTSLGHLCNDHRPSWQQHSPEPLGFVALLPYPFLLQKISC